MTTNTRIWRIAARTPLADVRRALRIDGYDALTPRAADIKRAAVVGALLWTRERIRTTDASRIDATPLTRP